MFARLGNGGLSHFSVDLWASAASTRWQADDGCPETCCAEGELWVLCVSSALFRGSVSRLLALGRRCREESGKSVARSHVTFIKFMRTNQRWGLIESSLCRFRIKCKLNGACVSVCVCVCVCVCVSVRLSFVCTCKCGIHKHFGDDNTSE